MLNGNEQYTLRITFNSKDSWYTLGGILDMIPVTYRMNTKQDKGYETYTIEVTQLTASDLAIIAIKLSPNLHALKQTIKSIGVYDYFSDDMYEIPISVMDGVKLW